MIIRMTIGMVVALAMVSAGYGQLCEGDSCPVNFGVSDEVDQPTTAASAVVEAMSAVSDEGEARFDRLEAGSAAVVGGRRVVVKQVEMLPLVENEYSRRFRFDKYENSKLKQLREQENLDEVVAAGKDEFEKQVLLLDWAYRRFKKFGSPTSRARGALDILKAIDEGHTFYCAHYGDVFVSAAASMGWVDRMLALRLGNHRTNPKEGGSTEHTITEIWSNQYGKWVMFDPTYALYVEKDGVPLSAWEVRQAWFGSEASDLRFVIGAERKKYKLDDLPIFRANHPGFGRLQLASSTLDKLAFLAYIPNTDLMDGGCNWDKAFITRDELCEGVKWHKRDNPKEPGKEPYFPINQASLTVKPSNAAGGGVVLDVEAKTMTPNFLMWRYRLDGGEWVDGELKQWKLKPGENKLEMRAVNKFGVEGPVSMVRLEVSSAAIGGERVEQ